MIYFSVFVFVAFMLVLFEEFTGSVTRWFDQRKHNTLLLESHVTESTLPFKVPVSQKARGILALPLFFQRFQKHLLYQEGMTLEKVKKDLLSFEIFARPCPTRPRHGFVESRLINTQEDLSKILLETRAQDPNAELIFSAKIHAEHSSVLTTDGVLSIGPGHDGATSGRDAIQLIVAPTKIPQEFLTLCGIRENGYIEVVGSQGTVVQFRDGPKLSTLSANFIPFEVEVANVVNPCDDLLEWEAKVTTLPKGSVVYGKGHALTSHAAVHCVINNVPFITEFEPTIGQKLYPESSNFEFNEEEFLTGIALANLDNSNIYDYNIISESGALVLSLFHCWPRLQYDKSASRILGYVAQSFRLLCTKAIAGESRHIRKEGETSVYIERNNIYQGISDSQAFHTLIEGFVSTLKELPNFSTGYGGPLWLKCADLTVELHNAMIDRDHNKIIRTLNLIINQSHNGGLFLDKFIPKNLFDEAAINPSMCFLRNQKKLYGIVTSKKKEEKNIMSQRKIEIKNEALAISYGQIISCNYNGALPKRNSEFTKLLSGGSSKWLPLEKHENFYEVQIGNVSFKVF